jgi:ribosome-associated protein
MVWGASENGIVPDLVVTEALSIPEGELTERFSRSSGPGGQHVNTTDTRVELSWDVGASAVLTEQQRTRLLTRLAPRLVQSVLTIAASEFRSQTANRRAARERLAQIVRDASAPPPPARRPTRPTRGSKERRLAAKKRRGETKRGRGGAWE